MANWSLPNSALGNHESVRAGLGTPSPATKPNMSILSAVIILLFPLLAFGIITFERTLPPVPPLMSPTPRSFVQTLDNGYLLSIEANIRPPMESLRNGTALVKLDSLGNVERLLHFHQFIFFRGATAVSADSHYFLCGHFDERLGAIGVIDAIVAKVKAHNGQIIWRHIYSGPGLDDYVSVAPTPDGGCFATGMYTGHVIGVVRLDRNGTPRWERIFRPPFDGDGFGQDVLAMPDGGCIVSALFDYLRGEKEAGECLYIMGIDSFGELVWTAIDTACGSRSDYGYFGADLSFTPSGNVAVCGTYCEDTPKPFTAGYLKIFTPDGRRILDRLVMVRAASHPESVPWAWILFRGGVSMRDGGFALLGEETPDARKIRVRPCILRLNERGDSILCQIYPDGGVIWQWYPGIINTNDGGLCILSATSGIHLIKTDSLGMVHWLDVPMRSCTTSIRLEIAEKDSSLIHPRLYVSPNPFTKSARIHYQLPSASQVLITAIDINGRTVATLFEGYQPAGNHQLRWQPEGLAQGIYFIKLKTPDLQLLERTIILP
jgi:hypothetical protein